MMQLMVDSLAQWSGGSWSCRPDVDEILGVSQDTRMIGPVMLYVALVGERFDGHDYVREAFQKGAVAALVSNLTGVKSRAYYMFKIPLLLCIK